jgi:hypothetical protein
MLPSLSLVAFVVAAAAVWRLSHLLVYEAGPGGLFDRLRAMPPLAPLLGCFYCFSLWAALPVALWLGEGWGEILLLCLGLSGTAILIERVSAPLAPPPPLWHEAPATGQEPTPGVAGISAPDTQEDSHVLLRP